MTPTTPRPAAEGCPHGFSRGFCMVCNPPPPPSPAAVPGDVVTIFSPENQIGTKIVSADARSAHTAPAPAGPISNDGKHLAVAPPSQPAGVSNAVCCPDGSGAECDGTCMSGRDAPEVVVTYLEPQVPAPAEPGAGGVELERCPFCGADAAYFGDEQDPGCPVYVGCLNRSCEATGGIGDTAEEARTKWNHRHV